MPSRNRYVREFAGFLSQSRTRSVCLIRFLRIRFVFKSAAVAHLFNDVADRLDHQIRALQIDCVATTCGNDLGRIGRQAEQIRLFRAAWAAAGHQLVEFTKDDILGYIEKGKAEDKLKRKVYDKHLDKLHEELVKILGRLRFRTSYGQNVLKHTLEVVHLAGIMASEVGASVKVTKRAALLHDIGKAMTHEVEGSHASISAQLARRYGESQHVVHAIEAHHNEVELRTVEAVIVQIVDAPKPGTSTPSTNAFSAGSLRPPCAALCFSRTSPAVAFGLVRLGGVKTGDN